MEVSVVNTTKYFTTLRIQFIISQDINLVQPFARILFPVSSAHMVSQIAVRIILCRYLTLVNILK